MSTQGCRDTTFDTLFVTILTKSKTNTEERGKSNIEIYTVILLSHLVQCHLSKSFEESVFKVMREK